MAPKKKLTKKEKSVKFNERTRVVQATLAEFTLAYSQCVPANCKPFATIRPINEQQLKDFMEDIQLNGWSDQSTITVIERPPTDQDELLHYPTPLVEIVRMYNEEKKEELKKMDTKVYQLPIDPANDIWSVYVNEPKEVMERRMFDVVDGWHRITGLKRMKEANADLDIMPNIRIFYEIGNFND